MPGLSSWVLDRKLGGGGFGEVWLAKHAWNTKEKARAVKFCTDPVAKNRLVIHEQNVVRRVMKYAGDHPNIVPLLDCNLDGDIPWLMYEFVEGGTLADAMKGWGALPLPKRLGRAMRVLHAIASALGACHRLDPPLVHRDLKPQNVLMAGSVPRVTDFGIGSVVMQPKDDPATGSQTAYAARLPSALHAAGTALYAPPEQRFGSTPNPRDDVYALGIIAYQMVMADLMVVPGADAALELRDLKVPGELVTLVVTSVAMNADRRPKDATEWESRLAALLQKSQQQPGPTDASVTGSKPVLLLEPESTDRSESQPPRLGANDFEVPTPEPTAGLPVRTGAPLPVALELPPELPPVARRVRKPVRQEAEPKTPGNRKVLAMALGSVLILVLAIATVIALVSSGQRAEPTGPTARVEKPKNDPKGSVPDPRGGGTKGVSPQPKSDPPEPKGKPPEPKFAVSVPKPGETRDIEIAPGVKMTFCWIPESVGECQLGSPQEEQDYITKTFYEGKRPSWLNSETEAARGKFKTTGFWMGKYTVTQAEWKAVMGDNPSYFDGTKNNKAKGMDTSRFPVESVSWGRIYGDGKLDGAGFLNKINGHGGIEKVFGKVGKFRLPKEDEWEYACRGGRGNKQPFYWGDKLNGAEANCDGNFPYGANVNGQQYLGRTCAVDFTNDGKYPNHPWGLMHMHGNVWQWCEGFYDKTDISRVLRGGSWDFSARYSRTAYRYSISADFDFFTFGFRLVAHGLP